MRDSRSRARGAASLVVVMVLFFVMMMTALFNGRSLVFEQKTSANQYRYTQAFEAGEAGLQWALTMLNGGRVDADCTPTGEAAHSTFRNRYLTTAADTGQLQPVPPLPPAAVVTAGCVKAADGSWSCSCPTGGAASLAAPAGIANLPAFTVQFFAAPQPGMVRVRARGCSSFGSQCTTSAAERSDAYVEIDSLFALANGLRTPPGAALTALGDVDFAGADVRVTNTDEETRGITVVAGGGIDGNARLTSTPGSLGSQSVVDRDASVSTLVDGKMFVTYFGIDKASFQRLGAVTRVACSGGGCGSAIQQAYERGHRMVWVDSDNVLIDGATRLGTAEDPLLLVADGNVRLADTAQLHGVVYSTAATWDTGDGNAQVWGAAIAEGNFRSGGSTQIVYDAEVLSRLHFGTGTFVRVAGSWSDTR